MANRPLAYGRQLTYSQNDGRSDRIKHVKIIRITLCCLSRQAALPGPSPRPGGRLAVVIGIIEAPASAPAGGRAAGAGRARSASEPPSRSELNRLEVQGPSAIATSSGRAPHPTRSTARIRGTSRVP
jgi:hypothetical protein